MRTLPDGVACHPRLGHTCLVAGMPVVSKDTQTPIRIYITVIWRASGPACSQGARHCCVGAVPTLCDILGTRCCDAPVLVTSCCDAPKLGQMPIPEIRQRYARDTFQRYARDTSEIRQRYARDTPEIRFGSRDTPEIRQRYARDTPEIHLCEFQRYARDTPEIRWNMEDFGMLFRMQHLCSLCAVTLSVPPAQNFRHALRRWPEVVRVIPSLAARASLGRQRGLACLFWEL